MNKIVKGMFCLVAALAAGAAGAGWQPGLREIRVDSANVYKGSITGTVLDGAEKTIVDCPREATNVWTTTWSKSCLTIRYEGQMYFDGEAYAFASNFKGRYCKLAIDGVDVFVSDDGNGKGFYRYVTVRKAPGWYSFALNIVYSSKSYVGAGAQANQYHSVGNGGQSDFYPVLWPEGLAFGMSRNSTASNIGTYFSCPIETGVDRPVLSRYDDDLSETEPDPEDDSDRYQITAMANAHGTVTGGGLYDAGAKVTLTANPEPGYALYRWTGNLNDEHQFDETLTVTADRARTIVAEFGVLREVGEGKPFADIQSAVDASADGDVIYVGDGIYTLTQPATTNSIITLDRNLKIKSVNGREKTILQGNVDFSSDKSKGLNYFRSLTVLPQGAESVVSGFTFEYGYTSDYDRQCAAEMQGGWIMDSYLHGKGCSRGHVVRLRHGARLVNCEISGKGYSLQNGGNGISDCPCIVKALGCALIDRCWIHDNTSGGRCPTIVLSGDGCTLRSSLVTDNLFGSKTGTAAEYRGGGVYLRAGVIENCTITRNEARGTGGGVYDSNGNGIVRNSIVYGNTAAMGDATQRDIDGTATYDHCCLSLVPAKGADNIVADPMFEADAFAVKDVSPCVNAGVDGLWMASALDLAGCPRVKAPRVDIGAYERQDEAGDLKCGFYAATTRGAEPFEVGLRATVVGAAGSVTCTWDFGDGTPSVTKAADELAVSHVYTHFGDYTVTLTVNDGTKEAVKAESNFVHVCPAICYVSETGGNVAPFATEETAARRIQDALAESPKTILVSRGTYSVGDDALGLEVSEPVHIKAVDGPDVTFIDGGATYATRATGHRLLNMTANATIEGFALVNASGSSATYGWTAVTASAGTIKGCVISNDFAIGRCPIAALSASARIEDSVIDGTNTGFQNVNQDNSNALITLADNAVAERCQFVNLKTTGNRSSNSESFSGVVMSGKSVLRNCYVANNRFGLETEDAVAGKFGGGGVRVASTASGCVIDNCTIVNNYSQGKGGGIDVNVAKVTLRNNLVYGNTAFLKVTGDDVAKLVASDISLNSGSASEPKAVTPDICRTNAVGVALADNGTKVVGNVTIPEGARLFRRSRPRQPFALYAHTPCRDAGAVLDWMTPDATDIVGNPRIIFKTVDIGCCETDAPGGLSVLVK